MRYYSPLRYPGGKNKVQGLFKDIIKESGLDGCVYVEPFAGGASVALGLLIEGIVKSIVLNDADPSIYSFWYSCLNETDAFCNLLQMVDVNIEEWERQKEAYKLLRNHALCDETYNPLLLGFATFFLNRCNRSGIIKGGIIGGRQQKGRYGIDARFNKTELERRIRLIATYKNKIFLHCKDAKLFIENHIYEWPEKTLIYCDPPYVQKGRNLYMNYFTKEDHTALAQTIRQIQGKSWVVTYDTHSLIAELYGDFPGKKLSVNYSASHKRTTSVSDEYIFFSPNLIIPNNQKLTEL